MGHLRSLAVGMYAKAAKSPPADFHQCQLDISSPSPPILPALWCKKRSNPCSRSRPDGRNARAGVEQDPLQISSNHMNLAPKRAGARPGKSRAAFTGSGVYTARTRIRPAFVEFVIFFSNHFFFDSLMFWVFLFFLLKIQ